MRKFIRLLLLLLLFAAILPFTFPLKDGKPLLNWRELKLPGMPEVELPSLPDISSGDEGEAREPHEPVQLYRWTDASGTVQYSNERPPQGAGYEVVEVNPDANLLQSPQASHNNTGKQEAEQEGGHSGFSIPAPMSVSPDEAMNLVKDARQLRELSEQRLQQQQEVLR